MTVQGLYVFLSIIVCMGVKSEGYFERSFVDIRAALHNPLWECYEM
jgi:hypothetical protein